MLSYLANRHSTCSERLRSHLELDHATGKDGKVCVLVEKLLINDHGSTNRDSFIISG